MLYLLIANVIVLTPNYSWADDERKFCRWAQSSGQSLYPAGHACHRLMLLAGCRGEYHPISPRWPPARVRSTRPSADSRRSRGATNTTSYSHMGYHLHRICTKTYSAKHRANRFAICQAGARAMCSSSRRLLRRRNGILRAEAGVSSPTNVASTAVHVIRAFMFY